YVHALANAVRSLEKPLEQTVQQLEPKLLRYQPGQNRIRPHLLEMLLRLPAKSELEIKLEFECQFLRWTEYPPDAFHGLNLNPAMVTLFMKNQTAAFNRFLPQLLFSHLNLSHSDN